MRFPEPLKTEPILVNMLRPDWRTSGLPMIEQVECVAIPKAEYEAWRALWEPFKEPLHEQTLSA